MKRKIRKSFFITLAKNEEGSVMLVALLMLILLTIIGIASTTTTEIETQISGNERTYKTNLYRAEAAAMVALQGLDDASAAALKSLAYTWLHGSLPDAYIASVTNWSASNSAQALDSANRYFAVDVGIVSGGSLDMGEPSVREFAVYGRSAQNNGVGIVRIGYKRSF
jgi:Tfp pilus assembly protein PilX